MANIIGICVLSSKNNPIGSISPNLDAEFINTDKIFIDANLGELTDYIKEIINKKV